MNEDTNKLWLSILCKRSIKL